MQKELNNTKFLQPLDADTTKANIYHIRRRFMRWAAKFELPKIGSLKIPSRFCYGKKRRQGPLVVTNSRVTSSLLAN